MTNFNIKIFFGPMKHDMLLFCFYIYLLHDIIKVWLEYNSIYVHTSIYVFRLIMCYDLVGGRGRLVKVFCGRGAVNRAPNPYEKVATLTQLFLLL